MNLVDYEPEFVLHCPWER